MEPTSLIQLFVCIAIATKVIWELYLSPLARQRIPGPKRAAVSDLWTYWLQLRLRRTMGYHEIFERYGPVVRVGPNRVAFRNFETIKEIYSTHRFRKSTWWNDKTFGGAQNMLSTTDPAYHARCRRLSSPAFRGENLRAAAPVLLQEMEDLVSRLRNDCADGGHVDVIQLFPKLTLDVLGVAVLGVRFNQIATGDSEGPGFDKHLESWFIDKLLIQPLPSVIRKLPISRLQEIIAADGVMTRYVQDIYDQADEKSSEGRWSMLEAYKAYREVETGDKAPIPLIISDLCVMFMAGMETTAVSLAYVAYYLATCEELWRNIRHEVSAVNLRTDNFIDILRGLPYLNAFLREILRVHGPASIYFDRVVPKGGANLEGYFLPEGTQVGAQAYSSHLDERIFPRPHAIDPLRWVRMDTATGRYVNREDIGPEMNDNYFPFSLGVRSCVGKVLAELELALTTATLVKNFRIHAHKTTTSDSMSSIDLGALRPRARRCLFRFEYTPIIKV